MHLAESCLYRHSCCGRVQITLLIRPQAQGVVRVKIISPTQMSCCSCSVDSHFGSRKYSVDSAGHVWWEIEAQAVLMSKAYDFFKLLLDTLTNTNTEKQLCSKECLSFKHGNQFSTKLNCHQTTGIQKIPAIPFTADRCQKHSTGLVSSAPQRATTP